MRYHIAGAGVLDPIARSLALLLAASFAVIALIPRSACATSPSFTDVGLLSGGTYSQALAMNGSGVVVGYGDTAGGNVHAFRYTGSTLQDLGLLPGGTYSQAIGVNESGTVMGYADTSLSSQDAFVSNGSQLVDLTLGGGYAQPESLNNSGQVVGYSFTPGGALHAFFYDGNSIHDVGALPGGTFSNAEMISDSGLVAGVGDAADGNPHAFTYSGAIRDIGVLPGGSYSIPVALNASGTVLGYGDTPDGNTHSFITVPSGLQDLGLLPGGSFSMPIAINSAGQAVGFGDVQGGQTHTWFWDGASLHDIGTLPGNVFSVPVAINSSGQVIGNSTDSQNITHAYVYRGAGLVDLGTLGGPSSYAVAINAAGQVTGDSDVITTTGTDSHGFLFNAAGIQDLGALTGGHLSYAIGISSAGVVAGDSLNAGGNNHAVIAVSVLDTTPPTTVATLGGIQGRNGWYRSTVQVTLKATDPDDSPAGSGSDVQSSFYSVDGGSTATYGAPFSISGDGSHTLRYWSVDHAGNVETAHNISFSIDSTPPSVVMQVSSTILWPPLGEYLPVLVWGKVSDATSGVDASSASLSVVDSYGLVQPHGPVSLGSHGTFLVIVWLQAQRKNSDMAGRTYSLCVSALDLAGNTGSATSVIKVPHNL